MKNLRGPGKVEFYFHYSEREKMRNRERHTEYRVQTTIDASIGTYVNEELISESLPFSDVYFTSDNEWHAMDVKF